jgi:colicin import membrane protein
LTEWDVLHPQEDDFIVTNDAHVINIHYLRDALEETFRDRSDVKVFCDHRVDWQVPGITPHGPDVSVFEGLSEPWDPLRGTFMMKDMHARPLLAIEVTSPSTRKTDFDPKPKEYHQCGVPYYLIFDQRETAQGEFTELIAFRTTPEGYVRTQVDPEKGVWIPSVRVWFKVEGIWAVCATPSGEKILSGLELSAAMRAEKQRAEQESLRADEERARAERERERAEQSIRENELLRQKLKEFEERLSASSNNP